MVSHLMWRKSSYSGGEGGNCVEVATNVPATIAIRDSKDPDGPQLAFAPEAWSTFIDSVRGGEFAPR